jgi:diguanylate cyclase (GGDEF)-like protein/PAS domain S-box-containing protein
MSGWSAEFLRNVLDAAPEGIVITEAGNDQPVVYVNPAFEYLAGYDSAELMGRNLRLLQGNDREQEGRYRLQQAIERGDSCQVLIRNYRKNAGLVWVDMHLQPVRDADGRVTHFIGYHRDAGERPKGAVRALTGLPTWMREDRITGLATRAYFEELVRRDWALAQREMRELGLAIFDMDQLAAYNDTYGRAGGDACLRRIARLLGASFRRGSDLIGRWDGGGLAVLVHGGAGEQLAAHARLIVARLEAQQVHHPKSGPKVVTVSAGIASSLPLRDQPVTLLVHAAEAALARAKTAGRNRVEIATRADYAP